MAITWRRAVADWRPYNQGQLEAARPCGMLICELEGGVVTMDLTGVGSGDRTFTCVHASTSVLELDLPKQAMA